MTLEFIMAPETGRHLLTVYVNNELILYNAWEALNVKQFILEYWLSTCGS